MAIKVAFSLTLFDVNRDSFPDGKHGERMYWELKNLTEQLQTFARSLVEAIKVEAVPIDDFTNANHNHDDVDEGGLVSHTVLTEIGSNNHSTIDTHIGDATKHFTQAQIDHVNILNKGTKTHSQIDTHINDVTGDPHNIAADTLTFTNKTIDGSATGNTIKKVASVEEAGGAELKLKMVDIGDWNMDADATKSVAHGLTLANIRYVSGVVRRDDLDHIHDIPDFNVATGRIELYVVEIGATNVDLERNSASEYNSADYDSTSFNRGWISIWYTA